MRHLGYALVVVVCFVAIAVAAPKKPKGGSKQSAPAAGAPAKGKVGGAPVWKQLDPKVQAELDKFDKEYYALVGKQAYFNGAKVAKKAFEYALKHAGADSLQTDRYRQTLASAYQMAGDYTEAEKLYLEMVKLAEQRYGAESREVLNQLQMLNSIYQSQWRHDDSEKVYLRMLAITKKVEGDKSASYAQYLSSHAQVYSMRNEYSAAARLYEEALKVYEIVAPSKDDHSLMQPLQSLAGAYWALNQQSKAIPLFDRAVKISQTGKGVYPTMKTLTPWIIATQYYYGGRKDLSAPLFKMSIDLLQKEIADLEKNKPDDPMLPSNYGQLANMMRQSGDINGAATTLEMAMKKAKKGAYSGFEMQLADIRREQGKLKESLALYEESIKQLDAIAPDASKGMQYFRAELLKDLGDFKGAEKALESYMGYMTKVYANMKNMPNAGSINFVATNIYAGTGKLDKAEAALATGLDSAERELQVVLKTGTDADHAIWFAKNAYVLDTALAFHMNLAPTSAKASRLALTTLLRRKGRLLDAAAATLQTLRNRLSPADQKLLDELNSARAQLAKLTVAGPQSMGTPEEFAKAVAVLEDKVQKLEMDIAKKSAAYRTVTLPIELGAIQKLIPADATLVEIINYQPYDYKMSYAQRLAGKFAPRRYAAYVIRHKGDPVVVDLTDAATIDKAVEQFRKALADPDNDRVNDLGKALYDITMAKIIPKLGKATSIIVAPDGALNVVPFSALVDTKGEFLIKKYNFTYLTSGRDLLRLSLKTRAKGGGVMFADPKFDSTGPAAGDKGDKDKPKTRGRRSVDLASLQWPPLPGTAAEAEAVTKTMKGLKLYRGDDATETALKAIKAPKILHLATHGFFLPDEAPPEGADGPDRGASTPFGPMANTPMPTSAVENPLLRSGLALSGANKLLSGNEDGVLTALEATGLDLNGTKLVVLSACETGVGKVSNGDGVYGLRRSLVIAGAESLVMSLWQVDDYATKELMVGFYKKLSAGKARNSALRDTQLELLAKDKYKHPFYWAAFLPAGSTAPL